MTETNNIKLIATLNSSNSKKELIIAKDETMNSEIREITAHGINANLMRTSTSARARWREGIADTIVKIVKMIEATTKDVCRRESLDNIS